MENPENNIAGIGHNKPPTESEINAPHTELIAIYAKDEDAAVGSLCTESLELEKTLKNGVITTDEEDDIAKEFHKKSRKVFNALDAKSKSASRPFYDKYKAIVNALKKPIDDADGVGKKWQAKRNEYATLKAKRAEEERQKKIREDAEEETRKENEREQERQRTRDLESRLDIAEGRPDRHAPPEPAKETAHVEEKPAPVPESTPEPAKETAPDLNAPPPDGCKYVWQPVEPIDTKNCDMNALRGCWNTKQIEEAVKKLARDNGALAKCDGIVFERKTVAK